MLTVKTLETDRIFLRQWEDGDSARLYDLAKDPQIGPRAGWPVHKDVEDSREIIRTVLRAPETYAVILKESGLPVGSVGLKEPEVRFRNISEDALQMEIGYWLGREYWGNGLIPEAVQTLLSHGFEEVGCSVIWCAHYDFNTQSRRVIEKSGFVYQMTKDTTNLLGETHKTLFYALTKEDWQKL